MKLDHVPVVGDRLDPNSLTIDRTVREDGPLGRILDADYPTPDFAGRASCIFYARRENVGVLDLIWPLADGSRVRATARFSLA